MIRTALFLCAFGLILSACGDGGSGGIQVETAWCAEMRDSDIMARSLRGDLPGDAASAEGVDCVLIPVGTAYDPIEVHTNVFGQNFMKARLVRPDTGEPAELWVRQMSAGIE